MKAVLLFMRRRGAGKIVNITSMGGRISQLQKQEHKRFNCFYSSPAYSSDEAMVKHIDYEDQGKLYCPTREDLAASVIIHYN
jgi:NAD(P)-dependent dehydrogenase (short-subunit alcohol dehydrogenase family)